MLMTKVKYEKNIRIINYNQKFTMIAETSWPGRYRSFIDWLIATQQPRDVVPMLAQRWAAVYDACPPSGQRLRLSRNLNR